MDFLKKKMKELLDDDDKPKKDEKPAGTDCLLMARLLAKIVIRSLQWFP
jgi:hypothetical protein